MKIVLLSDDFPPKSFGGAGVVAFDQARGLVARGHQVIVITTVQEIADEYKILFKGVTIYQLYSKYHVRFRAYRSIYNPQTVSGVKNLLRELQPDVVHAHNIHTHLSYHTLLLARLYCKKVVLTMHDTMAVSYGKLFPIMTNFTNKVAQFDHRVSFWQQFREQRFRFNPLRNFVIRRYIKNVDLILSVSGVLAEVLYQNGIKNIKVLHNGIDVDTFVTTPEQVLLFKQKYNLFDKKILFFGGRISAAKGGDIALELLTRISRELSDVVLLIVGKEDGYVRNLLQEAKRRGLEHRLIVTGWLSRDDIPSAYMVSSVVLYLSVYMDPFGLVNLEAMAIKKPVIGTCFGGTSEIVIDGVTGYIVNPNNIECVTERTLALLKDEGLSQEFGNAGYDRVKNKFCLGKQISILERYYSR